MIAVSVLAADTLGVRVSSRKAGDLSPWRSRSFTSSGSTLTVRPNGSGNTFGFTTMMNGSSSARPRIVSGITG
jgi:hypothetical protein